MARDYTKYTVEGFGQNHSMGYDFHSYAQDIIDSLI
jgi:hypothetical protein